MSFAASSFITSANRQDQVKLPWITGHSLFHLSATPSESLLLLYATAALAVGPGLLGFMDAATGLTVPLGALAVTAFIGRRSSGRLLLALPMVGLGLVLLAFPIAPRPLAIVVLPLAFGLFLAPIAAVAPVLASEGLSPSKQAEAFTQINRSATLGGVWGLAVSSAWLAIGASMWEESSSLRWLLWLLGSASVWAGMSVWKGLPVSAKGSPLHDSFAKYGERSRPPIRLLFGAVTPYLLITFLLFTALGISFTSAYGYILLDLKGAGVIAIAAVLGFKIASYGSSRMFRKGPTSLMPRQVLALAATWRAAMIALLVAAGVALPTQVALAATLLIITLWGVSAAAIGVSGMTGVAQQAPPGRWKQAVTMYVAASNAGGVVGAWLAGFGTTSAGFELTFLAAAALALLAAVIFLRS